MLDCGTLADNATALARGLRFAGVSPATSVVLWAPNSPEWIAASLAVLAAGGVLVPVDDTADAAQFALAVDISDAALVFTAQGHLAAVQACIGAHDRQVFLLNSAKPTGLAPSWRALLRHQGDALPAPSDDMPAALLFTSGTTGAPKAFHLTHRNIASNVAALAALRIVGSEDRALLPLPLHHAYPFIVGTLSTLTLGTTIILPADISGPAILKALRDGRATTIIGVPRLYDAIVGAIDSRIAMRGWFARAGLHGLLRAVARLQKLTGVPFGRVLFAPIRRAVAPSLRILVSGGARLDAQTADRLEALGWTVLAGYGLAETASLFTGNRPRSRKRGSAGQPLAAGEIRIAHPDENGIGEVELRGPSVTAGYINDTDANRSAFTADGWFRTGDLGYVDRDGFLFVTGRAKEILVLGGGKKVNPEDIERIYGAAPQFLEIAVLEEQGALVALVRPDLAKLHDMGSTNIHDGVRIILAELARELPSVRATVWLRADGPAAAADPARQISPLHVARSLRPGLVRQPQAHRSGAGRRGCRLARETCRARCLGSSAAALPCWRHRSGCKPGVGYEPRLFRVDGAHGRIGGTVRRASDGRRYCWDQHGAGPAEVLRRAAGRCRPGGFDRRGAGNRRGHRTLACADGPTADRCRRVSVRLELADNARGVPAAPHRQREPAGERALRHRAQSRQLPRRNGDCRRTAIIADATDLLGR